MAEKINTKIKDLKKIIKQKLSHSYFLSSEESKNILSKLKYLPVNELENIIKILDAGEAKQNKMIEVLNEVDPKFNQNLKAFLDKEYKSITQELEEKEKKGADKLLDDIENK